MDSRQYYHHVNGSQPLKIELTIILKDQRSQFKRKPSKNQRKQKAKQRAAKEARKQLEQQDQPQIKKELDN